MTSGLRSLRDKTLVYFEQAAKSEAAKTAGIHDVLTMYTQSLRRAEQEDREALKAATLAFDHHAIIAGQMENDAKPTMFLVYPEGNWIEVTRRTPYIAIGATAYGKPILDRALTFETPLLQAMQLAYLSFDSTRVSTAGVGFPIDMLTFTSDRQWRARTYDEDDVGGMRQWWNDHIKQLAMEMPAGPWAEDLLPQASTVTPFPKAPRGTQP